jgi:fructose-1-phosphate kinase PfkB-like protein
MLPLPIYRDLVSDARENGTPVLADLSSPRLDSALEGRPDLVKLNDWELAEFVDGPVDSEERLRAGAERLLESGASAALVTRGEKPALALRDGEALMVTPPRFGRGSREGCGDTMMGAIAAAWARGLDWRQTLTLGAAAGAANFLRHGLGTGSAPVVDDLAGQVRLSAA